MSRLHRHRLTDEVSYLGGTKEANGLQVLHAVSVLRVDPLEQVNLPLQDLRLRVHHTHYTGLNTYTRLILFQNNLRMW